MAILVFLVLFILGASIGSFFSVVICRLHDHEKGIIFGASHCPKCKKNLKTQDLIPVFSYIFLGGKCRYCKKPISPFYFYLEITSGIALVLNYMYFLLIQNVPLDLTSIDGLLLNQHNLFLFLDYSLIIFLAILIAFNDFKYKEIPNLFFYLWIAAAIGSNFIAPNNILNILFGLAISMIFFGSQILLSRGKWLGSGYCKAAQFN